jgi:hypothetical protein
MQRGVSGIVLEQVEVFLGKLLSCLGQLPKPYPKLGRRLMHLQVSQFALRFGVGCLLE